MFVSVSVAASSGAATLYEILLSADAPVRDARASMVASYAKPSADPAHRTRQVRSEREQKGMDTPTPLALAAAVLTAPGWVRVGIAAPSERVREEAAFALAARIVDSLEAPVSIVLDGQMALPSA